MLHLSAPLFLFVLVGNAPHTIPAQGMVCRTLVWCRCYSSFVTQRESPRQLGKVAAGAHTQGGHDDGFLAFTDGGR